MKHTTFVMAAMILITACGSKKQTEEAVSNAGSETNITFTQAQMKNAGIATGKLQPKEISSVLRLNGKIDVPPQNMVSISVPMGGYLKTTKLLPGMHVSKGEAIAVMEDRQYIQLQQDYLISKVKIGYLEEEYKRQKDLNASKASSDKAYQQAEADFRAQQVLVGSLAEKLRLVGIEIENLNENNITRSINIYSPIDGYVSKVNVNIGRYINPTDVLFELIDPRDIHLTLKVFEKDLGKLYIGQKVLAYTNNQPALKHLCEIILIGKDLSPERNTDIHCHFETYDKLLVPGTYMNAEIEVLTKMSFALPEDAVVHFENKPYAFINTSVNQFEMVEVSTGNTENGYIEILSGENLKDKDFAIKGAYSILMSLKNKSED